VAKETANGTAGWSPDTPLSVEADGIETFLLKEQQDEASKPRKRMSRNVGGWISPNFAQVINRSWLEKDAPSDKFDLKAYFPQVGDTVLYVTSLLPPLSSNVQTNN
jgi:hypothetical protein